MPFNFRYCILHPLCEQQCAAFENMSWYDIVGLELCCELRTTPAMYWLQHRPCYSCLDSTYQLHQAQ